MTEIKFGPGDREPTAAQVATEANKILASADPSVDKIKEWYEKASGPGGYKDGVGPIGQMLFDYIGYLLQSVAILSCTHEHCTGNADGSASCQDCGGVLPDCLPPMLFQQGKTLGQQQRLIQSYRRIIQSQVEHMRAAAQRFREYETEHQRKVNDILASTDQSRIDDAMAKLERNRNMANDLEATIASVFVALMNDWEGTPVKNPWDNFRLCHCELSGEIHLLEVKEGERWHCELCEAQDPATPENVRKALVFLNDQVNQMAGRLTDNQQRARHQMG